MGERAPGFFESLSRNAKIVLGLTAIGGGAVENVPSAHAQERASTEETAPEGDKRRSERSNWIQLQFPQMYFRLERMEGALPEEEGYELFINDTRAGGISPVTDDAHFQEWAVRVALKAGYAPQPKASVK